VVGVSVEELLFAFTLGFLWSSVYEQMGGGRSVGRSLMVSLPSGAAASSSNEQKGQISPIKKKSLSRFRQSEMSVGYDHELFAYLHLHCNEVAPRWKPWGSRSYRRFERWNPFSLATRKAKRESRVF